MVADRKMQWQRRPCEMYDTGSNTRISAVCGLCGTLNYVCFDESGQSFKDFCNHNIAQNYLEKNPSFEFTNDRRSRKNKDSDALQP